MSAFERVSRVVLRSKAYDDESKVDLRTVQLPETPSDDGYDPYEHRNPPAPIKVWMAYFNFLRTLFGAGVLGLPLAVSQAGIVLGPVMIVFTGLLILYSHLNLLWILHEISRQLKIPRVPYAYGFRIALDHGPRPLKCFARCGQHFVVANMLLSQIGICTVFIIFTADCLRDLLDWSTSDNAILILIIPFMVLQYFMKNLKIVTYVSMIGNLLNFIGMILVFYYIVIDPQGDVITYNSHGIALAVAFGTCLFNMSAIGVVLTLERASPDPTVMTKKYGVLPVGIISTTIVFTIFGAMGYWSFGVMEENILRALPLDDMTAMVAIGLYMVAIALAYPIQCLPATIVVKDWVQHNFSSEPTPEMLRTVEDYVKPCFVIVTFIICYLTPYQGPFVAFVGNLCTSQLCLVYPALMELSIKYPSAYGKFKIHLIKCVIIVMLGLITFIFGVYLCGMLIMSRFHASQDSLAYVDDKW